MKRMNPGMAMVLALILGGCASQDQQLVISDFESFSPNVHCDKASDPEGMVDLEMVDSLMSKSRPYAALAQLQKAPQENQEYWSRYGRLLAETGDLSRAKTVFTVLRDECKSGEAYHGLGIVAMKQGDLSEAMDLFRYSVNALPASGKVRNDYGYALLVSGDYEKAQYHLRTALELQNGQGVARQNLAIAYILGGNERGIAMLKEQYGFKRSELERAERLASGFGVEL
ncbi:MAG: hypothetical protein AOY29_10670 [Alcanivorax borkumensis]|uniref:Uncharacterized protein n=1 Tax=Alcanivorax borkumensis (strain ATCC 700651 / DSM 11573 / NCIMB 13689 / SK2) TaxID=393595 RepID=Q0VT48_ALCBS|nr:MULTISPECIES: hypothetical protein [Alcanivorax]OJH08122.1 MAG: hypothetical protein AOY29_10670 [Alcanivorax borkumensis]EUC68349.1 hypothetical protein Y017_05245 [Alcanivorax sp. 97CO-5]PKG00711.1 hypothetical protein Y019_12345 [Alcanivorax sp. 97CO-6]CAL15672.1 conserved hypothetical protein [Alcanivorax borkumensis SK2]BAP13083.1 hypothetical protein AS19_02320 [Alcanivorax sp. NBRC 101098]